MRTVVWVGRVKSTTAPALLEAAFGRIGTVSKVETGFAGFAFVEFENEDDADKACEELNKSVIQHVGEIRVAKATIRGYEDAVNKRDSYWRSRGEEDGAKHLGIGRCGRSRGRDSQSRSRRRQRAASQSRSRPKRRRKRSRSASRSRSYSGSRKSSASIQRENKSGDEDNAREDRYQDDRSPLQAPQTIRTQPPTLALANVEEGDEAAAGLSRTDRAKVVCFYDGAHACDLLIEGAAVMKVPDEHIPDMLNAFPHGFPSISQEAAMRLLEGLSTFSRNSVEKAEDEEQSVEIRQTLAVNKQGERVMRKALLVNNVTVCKEEQVV